jgi:hypothetical protein
MSHGNTKDFLMVCKLLENLHDLSDYHWRVGTALDGSDLKKGPTMRNYERMTWKKRPITPRELDSLVDESRSSCLHLEGFYLPPLDEDKDFIPILSLECDLGSSPPSFSLRVGMTKFANDRKRRAASVGFRFEMGQPNSNHNYHHMQLTARPHDQPLHGCPPLPETYPCVIMPARCAVSLVLCLLLSMYGSKISKTKIFPPNIDKKYKVPLEFLI